ncbi:MAG: rhamnogalacturonan acetylesterase [Opitutaceae bacterium]|jgi:lysophospholipase L1-like esterase|nr:rhamnogalacturonan acetylesterase [Opitutaceae bacterium]
MHTHSRFCFAIVLSAVLSAVAFAGAWDEPAWQFWLAPGAAPAGWTKIAPDSAYTDARACGYEATDGITQNATGTTADRPYYFSAGLAEGNYRVAVTFSGTLTVKTEVRRLVLENAVSVPGATSRREFIVNIRRDGIVGAAPPDRTAVNLKPRERAEEKWNWDDKLTLEFNTSASAFPAVAAIEITRAEDVPTLFLLGDSTVCDQPREPYASWGQMLTRFFKPTIAVANHAESGESYQSALGRGRLAKILSQLRPGDTVMLQFGHNDMKSVDVPAYTASIRQFVSAIRAKKAAVVLVTQMQRRTFGEDGKITNSHKGYPDAVREVAREEKLPLIDLHAMSMQFYEALGKDGSAIAFKPGDGTHHNAYGAYELAKCIVQGIRDNKLPLARHIEDDFAGFAPAKPDAPESLKIPPSLTAPGEKPDGS